MGCPRTVRGAFVAWRSCAARELFTGWARASHDSHGLSVSCPPTARGLVVDRPWAILPIAYLYTFIKKQYNVDRQLKTQKKARTRIACMPKLNELYSRYT